MNDSLVVLKRQGKLPKAGTQEGVLLSIGLRHLDSEMNIKFLPVHGQLGDQPGDFMDFLFSLRGAVMEYRASLTPRGKK